MNLAPCAKRAVVFQDLSGLGRCALSVAIPALCAMNVQPCPVPTAVLSAHTAFPSSEICDLTGFVEGTLAHYRGQDFSFDAALTGYLPGVRQAALIADFLDSLRAKRSCFVLVDPAMADHGKLYRALPDSMPEAMRALCQRADIITPNPTEAALLLGMECSQAPYDLPRAARMLEKLTALGASCAIITGATMPDGRMANLCKRSTDSGFFFVPYASIPGAYPGAGDLLSAAVLGGVLRGETPHKALARATAFVHLAIERTRALNTPAREGLQFEAVLGELPTIEGFAAESVGG